MVSFQVRILESSIAQTKEKLSAFLNEDQVETLKYRTGNANRWKKETIKTALQIRCACGIRGCILLFILLKMTFS